MEQAPAAVDRVTGPQLFAGAFGLVAGMLVGAVAAVPAIFLLPELLGWSVGALLVIVLAAIGVRVFSARSTELLAGAGLAGSRFRTITQRTYSSSVSPRWLRPMVRT